MRFQKNLGPRERIVRIAAGAAIMLCGLAGLGMTPLGLGIAAVGAVSIATGLARYCPACAIAGKNGDQHCRSTR